MKTTTLLLIFLVTTANLAWSGPADSVTTSVEKKKVSRMRLTTRLHSMGLFSYGGRLVSSSPVMDFNFQYDRKTWGFQLFKAMDLRDSRTPINFTLAAFNKNFRVGKRLTVTPMIGAILEQYTTIADHGSDAVFILITSLKVSNQITVEYTALGGNLVLEPELRDWVNRFRLLYSNGHLDVTLMGWHNNSVFDEVAYATCGASIFYSRAKLTEGLTMSAGVTGLVMAHSSDEYAMPKVHGAFFTLGFLIQ